MTDFSRLANLAEILSAIIVVGGIFFALMQMQQTLPAYEAHADWKPMNLTADI